MLRDLVPGEDKRRDACGESITAFGPGDENRFLLALTWRSFLVPLHGSLATVWCGAT